MTKSLDDEYIDALMQIYNEEIEDILEFTCEDGYHEWLYYEGFMYTFEYCKHCDRKRRF